MSDTTWPYIRGYTWYVGPRTAPNTENPCRASIIQPPSCRACSPTSPRHPTSLAEYSKSIDVGLAGLACRALVSLGRANTVHDWTFQFRVARDPWRDEVGLPQTI